MAIAQFKDLCLDVVDEGVMSTFWSNVAGLRPDPDDAGKLVGPSPAHTIWLNIVAEEKTVKHRVHLDVTAGSVAQIGALGAKQASADGEFAWTVMTDPEGGEFCVFVRDTEPEDAPDYRLLEVVVDAKNPTAIASWWAGVFKARLVHDERGFSYIDQIPNAPIDAMTFVPVPESKSVKNRIHWDVTVKNRKKFDKLVELGAAVVRERDDEIEWTVLADPEGNEFCAFLVME